VARSALDIYADVMLPASPYLEKDGHYTDWEGRSQRLRRVRPPRGLARSEWEIFQELSQVLGRDLGFRSLDDLHEEMGRLYGAAAVPERSIPQPEPAAPPTAPEDGSLVLFSYPLLVDEGRLSTGAHELKDALEELPFVEVSVEDAERLGLSDGAMATVETAGGRARLPVRVTDGIAPGAAFVPWNQPGFHANSILSGSAVTAATLEPATEEVSVG
jgi:NADH-quinone oxidoreductase subunit G